RKKNGEDVSVIGVDRDQKEEGMPEDVTLTSVIKRVDRAVEDTANSAKDGKLEGGKTVRYGLKEDGVDIVPSEKISKKTMTALEKAKAAVVSGKIEVPEQ
ncbi:BMP family ABC transporter substrate-binding protein, partial [Exiguobacterium sp.]